jgi:hypothetical protein
MLQSVLYHRTLVNTIATRQQHRLLYQAEFPDMFMFTACTFTTVTVFLRGHNA